MDASIPLATSIAICYVGFQLYLVKVAVQEIKQALSDVDRKLD